MVRHWFSRVVGLALGCAAALAAFDMAGAATPGRAAAGGGLPDWSGVYVRANQPGGGGGEVAPYNDKYKAIFQANSAKAKIGQFVDPLNFCLPRGMPSVMNLPDQYEFGVTPEATWVFAENGAQVRRIYTDGRKQLSGAALKPTYMGDSVGHWEGDTLVATTVGLRDDMILDRQGYVLSGEATITERFRMSEPGLIAYQVTIVDPGALTRPWVLNRSYRRQAPDSLVFDYACAENNRNPVDAEGKARLVGPDGGILD